MDSCLKLIGSAFQVVVALTLFECILIGNFFLSVRFKLLLNNTNVTVKHFHIVGQLKLVKSNS